MNSGILTERYAKAFYDFAGEQGRLESVYGQCRTILSAMSSEAKFRKAILAKEGISFEIKLSLLESAVAPEPLCEELARLLTLMHRNGRQEYFRLVLLGFLNLYREEKKLIMVQVTTAVPDIEMDGVIRHYLETNLGRKAIIKHKVDSSIVGGFIYESWGYRVNASIRKQLDLIKDALTDYNKRMV